MTAVQLTKVFPATGPYSETDESSPQMLMLLPYLLE